MNELEEYLLTNNTINENNYKQFNYNSYEEFKIDLDFLLSNIYSDIQIINLQTKEQRLNQDTFRKEVIKKYNKCIISHSIDIECEACHIIPYSICKNFDVDNYIQNINDNKNINYNNIINDNESETDLEIEIEESEIEDSEE